MLDNRLQEENAPSLRFVEFGIVTPVKLVQLLKAWEPMKVMEFGIVTPVKLVQL